MPGPGHQYPVSGTVDLVYFDAGGGHRASALALQAAIQARGPSPTVRLVNLREVLDPNNSFRKLVGVHPEQYYNARLARGWTLGLAQELKLLQGIVRWAHPPLVRILGRHWSATRPDLVVSLIPNFNRALCQSLASALPGTPFVTVMTDLADHPPRFWIEEGLDQHVICGSRMAVDQAQAAGLPDERIHATSGMIIRAGFYEAVSDGREVERRRLGLEGRPPTGMVLFGGQGSKAMLEINRRLPDTPLILACGHNRRLAQTLRALPAAAPRIVVGFTPDIAPYMALADFFIGKPGPGSLSEAIQMNLPVIVVANRWTLPQERYNAQWIRDQGLGIVMPSFRQIGAAVQDLTRNLERFRSATLRVRNRAVFELPDILNDILAHYPRRESLGNRAFGARPVPQTGFIVGG
jgi:UDP-N-acetylglucosamine:LPS N-acetylglucosamine transferase